MQIVPVFSPQVRVWLQQPRKRYLRPLLAVEDPSTISGASNISRNNRSTWDDAMPSRATRSAALVRSPHSSKGFSRNARASALTRVLSLRRSFLNGPATAFLSVCRAAQCGTGHEAR